MSDGTPPSTNGAVGSISEAIHAQYDWTLTRPSIAVIETIATARNENPTDLPALSSYIDLDALDRLFKHKASGQGHPDIQLSFSFEAHEVTVGSGGTVMVIRQGAAP